MSKFVIIEAFPDLETAYLVPDEDGDGAVKVWDKWYDARHSTEFENCHNPKIVEVK
jgi:hypothetical protein